MKLLYEPGGGIHHAGLKTLQPAPELTQRFQHNEVKTKFIPPFRPPMITPPQLSAAASLPNVQDENGDPSEGDQQRSRSRSRSRPRSRSQRRAGKYTPPMEPENLLHPIIIDDGMKTSNSEVLGGECNFFGCIRKDDHTSILGFRESSLIKHNILE